MFCLGWKVLLQCERIVRRGSLQRAHQTQRAELQPAICKASRRVIDLIISLNCAEFRRPKKHLSVLWPGVRFRLYELQTEPDFLLASGSAK